MKATFITLTALAVFGAGFLGHPSQANAGFSIGVEIGPRYVPPPPPPVYAYVPVYETRYYEAPYRWYPPPRYVEYRERHYWRDGYDGCRRRHWERW